MIPKGTFPDAPESVPLSRVLAALRTLGINNPEDICLLELDARNQRAGHVAVISISVHAAQDNGETATIGLVTREIEVRG